MDLTALPFNAHVGLLPGDGDNDLLRLPDAPHLLNHLGTVHASALFSLAEAASGQFLPRAVEASGRTDIGAVVRKAEAKYAAPANGELIARSTTGADGLATTVRELAPGKRTLTAIDIDLHTADDTRVARFTFTWFLFTVEAS